jgi:hypothetical protein
MHDNDGLSEITEKFLGNGELFGIKFNQGFVFLEVESFEQVKFAPFDNIGDIAGGGTTNFARLEDDDGDDILYLEQDQSKVIHASIGQSPAGIRRYTNYPESETRLRRIDNLGSPVVGDDYGYVDGEDSPYEMPTDAEELWIPPKTHLDFAFANTDNRQREPILNILMRIYRIDPLDPDVSEDRNAIKRIVQPGSPMPVVMAGGPDFQIDYQLDSAWNTEPIPRQRVDRIKQGGN